MTSVITMNNKLELAILLTRLHVEGLIIIQKYLLKNQQK